MAARKKLFVKENEFLKQNHPQYTKLLLYPELGTMDRMVAFLCYLVPTLNMTHLTTFSFSKRAEFTNSGYIQERIDAVFEMARLANFKLNYPWEKCLKLYEKVIQIDSSRPESFYFIGIHYFLENQILKAYSYFKQAFLLGFPEHCQHGLKPTITYYFVPTFLAKCCYFAQDFELGLKTTQFFFQNNTSTSENWNEMISWQNIYLQMEQYTKTEKSLENNVAIGAVVRLNHEVVRRNDLGGFVEPKAKQTRQTVKMTSH